MRAIKLRLHDVTTGKIFGYEFLDDTYSDNLMWDTEFENGEIRSGTYSGPAKRVQYTGLKDKNGKEIYDDDIVKDIEGELYRVWIEDGAMLYGGLNKEWDVYLRQMDNTLMEVISNIYESPEY